MNVLAQKSLNFCCRARLILFPCQQRNRQGERTGTRSIFCSPIAMSCKSLKATTWLKDNLDSLWHVVLATYSNNTTVVLTSGGCCNEIHWVFHPRGGLTTALLMPVGSISWQDSQYQILDVHPKERQVCYMWCNNVCIGDAMVLSAKKKKKKKSFDKIKRQTFWRFLLQSHCKCAVAGAKDDGRC